MENNELHIGVQIKSPKEIVEYYIHSGENKASMPFLKLALLGIMAGALIAFGASSAAVSSHLVANAGLAKTIAGLVFPVGLIMILLFGAELFTSGTMMVLGVVDKKYSVLKMLKAFAIIYFSNMVGAVMIVFMLHCAGQFDFTDAIGAYTIKVAIGKVHLDFMPALVSGILCNLLVCGATLMAATAKDVIGKIFGALLPIFVFIIGGFEHCVANMFYIPAGILASKNPEYVSQLEKLYGYGAEHVADLNLHHFFINNLVPVTIGNIIGGFMISLTLYYCFVRKAK